MDHVQTVSMDLVKGTLLFVNTLSVGHGLLMIGKKDALYINGLLITCWKTFLNMNVILCRLEVNFYQMKMN